MALASPDITDARNAPAPSHARLSVVVPIGITVAVAILCVVVAVLGSAQRADEVALDTERQLFTRALANHGDRVLRELETVAGTEAAHRRIRVNFDAEWINGYIGGRLQSLFDHDFVFIADPSNRFLYASLGSRSVDPNWFNSVRPDLKPILDHLRGQGNVNTPGTIPLAGAEPFRISRQQHRAARLQTFLNRPAIVAAIAIPSEGETAADVSAKAPIVLSVKLIDEDVLAEIASRLQLRDLRLVGGHPPTNGEYVYDLTDRQGVAIAQFAWMPKRPGAEIVTSVFPFIAVALAGFALLAALVWRHMRRTAATIAAGEVAPAASCAA